MLFFGSGVSVSAFYPEHYSQHAGHSTPGTHFGTAFDLFNGNTNNGATIGLYNSHNGWNQRINFFDDKTIRVGGKCLDYNGAKVHLWDCFGSNWQKWRYDTEGRLRLVQNTDYCLDSDNGSANKTLYIWQCGNYTETFRAGQYTMYTYARKSGNISPLGHAMTSFAKFDSSNWMECFATYTLWPENDNRGDIGCQDRTSRGWWDNVIVNREGDWNETRNLSQNGNNSTYLSYWQKSISANEFTEAVVGNGYQPPNSTYLYIANCSNYSTWLWNKYVNQWSLNLATTSPNAIYYTLQSTDLFD
jgi:hypothetical protein